METFSLKLLASDKDFFEGEASSIILPSSDGYYGIMANHSNAVIALVPGMATIVTNNTKTILFISSGIAKIENGKVLVLVESCENSKDIDENRAKAALKEAKDELARKQSRFDTLSAEIKIARALNRIKVKERIN